ncbi:MAG: flagellar protein FlbD [Dehalococcoidia bacterium]|nr:flagellar protein FlbD [Dehalococcoidia bacterium]
MIRVSGLQGRELTLNADLIETIERTPDTIIKLTNERRYIVREAPEEVVRRVIEFRQAILSGPEIIDRSAPPRSPPQ